MAWTNEDLTKLLAQNPGATDKQKYDWAMANGVNATQAAQVLGTTPDAIGSWANQNKLAIPAGAYSDAAASQWGAATPSTTTAPAASQSPQAWTDDQLVGMIDQNKGATTQQMSDWAGANNVATDQYNRVLGKVGLLGSTMGGTTTGTTQQQTQPTQQVQQPAVAPAPVPFQPVAANTFQPAASDVDAKTETIEGRLENLLSQNNPLIRQAGERAMAQFAQRGLLNSSMAVEAANEAMISKAIDIAGPDAATYFQNRKNQTDWLNKFTQADQQNALDISKINSTADANIRQSNAIAGYGNTLDIDKIKAQADANIRTNDANLTKQQDFSTQQSYQTAISTINTQHNQQIQALQSSEMDAADKQVAMDSLVMARDNSIRLMTATFQQFPQWKTEWSSLVNKLPTA